MSRWTSLREEIERARRDQPRYDLARVTAVIKRLGVTHRCSPMATHWLGSDRGPERSLIHSWTSHSDARDGRGHPAIRLRNLSQLIDWDWLDDGLSGPVLSYRAVLDRSDHVRSFSVGITGHQVSLARWYARVELTEKPEGQGDCGHPLLHAHIGDDPDAALSPRAPLPWMLPHEALEWLLATVDPALEPAP